MDSSAILIYILVGLTVLSVISQVVLFIILSGNRSKKEKTLSPPEEKLLDETREKSNNILSHAVKEANKIVTNAELSGIKLFSQEKLETRKATQDFESRLKEMENTLVERLNETLTGSLKSYDEFLSSIERSVTVQVDQNQKLVEHKISDFMHQEQLILESFVGDIHEKVRTQIDRELAAAKAEIEEYKTHRLHVVDQNIVAIIERTVQTILGKKLTLTDQSDLVLKALEEAKSEHIVTAQ
jgi:hypothetical protein